MEKEKIKKLSEKLSADRNNYMSAFRNNLYMILESKALKVRELAELADVPFSTLNTFLYGNSKDCNLATAVKLAHAIGISLDELVGAETINAATRKNMCKCRNLPEASLYLIQWHIDRQCQLYNKPEHRKLIPVIEPKCSYGHLEMSNITELMDIEDLSINAKAKIFLGIKLKCEHYMPFYSPYEILLLAADRKPNVGETCVIMHRDKIFLMNKTDNGYSGLVNPFFELTEAEIDRFVGYIVCTKII